jgi:hypothetical protein
LPLFAPAEPNWTLDGVAFTGGRALSGLQQYGRIDGGGFWTATLSGLVVRGEDSLRIWDAWGSILDGGVTPVVVHNFKPQLSPYVSGFSRPTLALIGDGSPQDVDPTYDGLGAIRAKVKTAAALRATTLVITMTVGSGVKAGHHFAIDHPTFGKRLYRVGRVTAVAGSDYTVEIRPPLREAVLANDLIDFNTPGCVMRLADPDAFKAPLQLGRIVKASITFTEHFDG